EVEEPGGEGVGSLADHDAAGIGQALHALREPDRVADRHDVRLAVAVMRAAHDDLAGVEADADREAGPLLEAKSLGVAADVVLHAERRVERSPRVVLVGNRRAEEREDAVAGGLHDVTLVARDRVAHEPEGRRHHRLGLLRIELRHQVHRALDVGEECGDDLALAFGRIHRTSSGSTLSPPQGVVMTACAVLVRRPTRVNRAWGSSAALVRRISPQDAGSAPTPPEPSSPRAWRAG